jgi:transketolase
VLADLGFFPKEELKHLRQLSSLLQAYPTKKVPGVVVCSAGPGHGFSAAVGLAMSLKMDKMKNRVFCMAGDGELQEGQIWEAAMTAAQHKLDNLILTVDYNDLQMDGTVRSIMGVEPIADKFQAFGWKTIPVRDGHDYEELLLAYERSLEGVRRPSVVIAKTVKGKGIEFAENKAYYHAEVLSDQEMAEALPRLKVELAAMNKPK